MNPESFPMRNPEKNPNFVIPESEMRFLASRSGGAGGQNVNKRESKVTALWNFRDSNEINDAQKTLLTEKLKNRINAEGELYVHCQEERGQQANRQRAIQIMNEIVNQALSVSPERKETKVPKSEKEKRIKEKKAVSEKKSLRRKIDY